LTFFNGALGKFYPGMPEAQAVARLIVEKIPYLAAISAGAVFMGANTYIGNAPNFMVKSIAEEAGVKMPSFFGYMFKYSIPILVVLFIVVTFVFF
jgi:Na+/H+ antiporter NhaD/arsenite permease-like protein